MTLSNTEKASIERTVSNNGSINTHGQPWQKANEIRTYEQQVRTGKK